MESNKEYITQITRDDLKQIADVANMHPGDGIEITPASTGLEISIDRGQFTRWVKTIMAGGNI